VVRERTGVYYSTEPLLENERLQLGTMGATRAPEHSTATAVKEDGAASRPLAGTSNKGSTNLG
jgi:hypothetical protein